MEKTSFHALLATCVCACAFDSSSGEDLPETDTPENPPTTQPIVFDTYQHRIVGSGSGDDGGGIRYGLLAFPDLSQLASDVTIESATLTVAVSVSSSGDDGGGGVQSSEFFDVLVPWDQFSPSGQAGTDYLAERTGTVANQAEPASLDVRASIERWRAGAANLGWVFVRAEPTVDPGATAGQPVLTIVFAH